MPYNQMTASGTSVQNDLFKLIVGKISSAYRMSTPLLKELTAPGRKGANPDGVVGFFDRFENSNMYLDVVDYPIMAVSSGPSAKLASQQVRISQFVAQCKTMYASAQYENFAEDITAGNKAAVRRVSDILVDQMTNGFKRMLNRELWGDAAASGGSWGYSIPTGYTFSALALTSGTGSGSSTITVTSVDTNGDRSPFQYLVPGMAIRIQSATGGTSNSSFADYTTITAINTSTSQLTVADSMTWATGKYIIACAGDGTYPNEIQGIPQLVVNSGTVQGINLATLSYGTSHILSNGSAAFTPVNMQKVRLQCQVAKPNKYFANQTVYNEMGMYFAGGSGTLAERTGMGDDANLDVGFDSFTAHNGTVEVFLDYDCPGGSLYELYTPGFTLGILKDVHLVPMTMMRIPNYVVYEIVMGWEGNLANAVFDANAILNNIT